MTRTANRAKRKRHMRGGRSCPGRSVRRTPRDTLHLTASSPCTHVHARTHNHRTCAGAIPCESNLPTHPSSDLRRPSSTHWAQQRLICRDFSQDGMKNKNKQVHEISSNRGTSCRTKERKKKAGNYTKQKLNTSKYLVHKKCHVKSTIQTRTERQSAHAATIHTRTHTQSTQSSANSLGTFILGQTGNVSLGWYYFTPLVRRDTPQMRQEAQKSSVAPYRTYPTTCPASISLPSASCVAS